MRLLTHNAISHAARVLALTGALLVCAHHAVAQNANDAPADARARAPIDLTGYWVSIVTEDWRFRMLVADPGDTDSVPLNPHGVQAAKAWDPAKDRANPDAACKAFGAAALMRIPGRLHISWQDGSTLQVQTDSGTQSREFHFAADAPASLAASWQGYSKAAWDGIPLPTRGAARLTGQKEGFLKVMTTGLRSGYLRTNGVPYSEHAQLLEYYDSFKEANADIYLVITTIVTDPEYLNEPFVTSTHFRKIPDGQGWDPTPCRADVPR
jgi:hypothetical protein